MADTFMPPIMPVARHVYSPARATKIKGQLRRLCRFKCRLTCRTISLKIERCAGERDDLIVHPDGVAPSRVADRAAAYRSTWSSFI